MLSLVDDALEGYAAEHARPVSALMDELREYTFSQVDMPQMQVGPIEGNFLKILARLCRARRIVEVGTFTGYSGLMMASALPEDGELITCEIDPKIAAIARSFFDRSGFGTRIGIRVGPAAQSLASLDGPFDMAFIDADKQNYVTYFDLLRPKMRPGGLIVADNVLWSGKVLARSGADDVSTRGIRAFNAHVRGLASLDKVMLTVRDGMMLVIV